MENQGRICSPASDGTRVKVVDIHEGIGHFKRAPFDDIGLQVQVQLCRSTTLGKAVFLLIDVADHRAQLILRMQRCRIYLFHRRKLSVFTFNPASLTTAEGAKNNDRAIRKLMMLIKGEIKK